MAGGASIPPLGLQASARHADFDAFARVGGVGSFRATDDQDGFRRPIRRHRKMLHVITALRICVYVVSVNDVILLLIKVGDPGVYVTKHPRDSCFVHLFAVSDPRAKSARKSLFGWGI